MEDTDICSKGWLHKIWQSPFLTSSFVLSEHIMQGCQHDRDPFCIEQLENLYFVNNNLYSGNSQIYVPIFMLFFHLSYHYLAIRLKPIKHASNSLISSLTSISQAIKMQSILDFDKKVTFFYQRKKTRNRTLSIW